MGGLLDGDHEGEQSQRGYINRVKEDGPNEQKRDLVERGKREGGRIKR